MKLRMFNARKSKKLEEKKGLLNRNEEKHEINSQWTPPPTHRQQIISTLSPLLENSHPSPEVCHIFSQHCRARPRSSLVPELFTPIVQRILKHNVDFSKNPCMRTVVQDYFVAISLQNNGMIQVRDFIVSIHSPNSTCPHPRVLPNLASVTLAAIFSLFETKTRSSNERRNSLTLEVENWSQRLDCYITILETIVSYEDWRPGFAQILQPIPFPNEALTHNKFSTLLKNVMCSIATDPRCEVHSLVLGLRESKDGWFDLYCPGNLAASDDGQVWTIMLKTLMGCCGRRKKFLQSLTKKDVEALVLLAIRDDVTCQDVLVAMLELDVVENSDQQQQLASALQATESGREKYGLLSQRLKRLTELRQKGGPRNLTLPPRATDEDVAKMFSCGSFGNLECLNLSFTHVTSACALELIKLPSLHYLNLWNTQFGDEGLQLIAEHLHKLQVLNLCETPVTSQGLQYLTALKNLRQLNLNSTKLTSETFEDIKRKLPNLEEFDIRYTDAF